MFDMSAIFASIVKTVATIMFVFLTASGVRNTQCLERLWLKEAHGANFYAASFSTIFQIRSFTRVRRNHEYC